MGIRTPELADTIIAGISAGVTLRDLCRRSGVGKSAVYEWIEEDKEFAGRFARARLEGFDAIAEECVAIAEDGTNDWMETETGHRLNPEHVQRSKLRIETRLKLLAKWDPKRYGDKTDVNLTGDLTVVVKKLSGN